MKAPNFLIVNKNWLFLGEKTIFTYKEYALFNFWAAGKQFRSREEVLNFWVVNLNRVGLSF